METNMQTRYSPHPDACPTLGTEQLRANFLVETLFTPGKIELIASDADRAIFGSAVPVNGALNLVANADMRAAFFCERRELGILNIGGAGTVEVDGSRFDLEKCDCLYVGRGSQKIQFTSCDDSAPALFYLLSYPAHANYPTSLSRKADAEQEELGTQADANHRTIHRHIHLRGVKSCQLVMGFTKLEEGSVWNTLPAHTHARRSEIYLYFDMGDNRRVMHFMGRPQQTRHVVVAERQVVISPSWSIHSGCGTGAYTFCWGMGGENQVFNDMDPAPLSVMR